MKSTALSLLLLAGCPLGPAALPAAPGAIPAAAGPRWLTGLSVSGRLGYDSNLFCAERTPPGGTRAEHGAWTGSFGLEARISVSALLEGPREALQLAYAPTAHWFEGVGGEDHTQHRFTVQSAGRRGDWSWSCENTATYTDGPDDSPRFDGFNIFGMGAVRDRRTQLQDAGKGWLRYDRGGIFLRGTAAALVCDYRTDLRAPSAAEPGRLNWVDRDDVNGGLDVGWKISPATSLFVGARLGRQQQATTAWITKSSSNHYTRALLGLEGRPVPWLSGSLVVGPDFRRYAAATQCMSDRTPVAWHYAGTLTAKLGATDSLTLMAKQERWLSSTGQSAYDAKTLSLTWQHGFSDAWFLQLSGQWQQGRYPAPIVRNDVLSGGQAQLRWRATERFAVTLDATVQNGGDRVDLPATAGRAFRRSVLGIGVQRVF